jgi:hypothetical protein
MIENTEQLKKFFVSSKAPLADGVYVSTAIRREWMLNHEKVIIKGVVYSLKFTNIGGGVWQANCDA